MKYTVVRAFLGFFLCTICLSSQQASKSQVPNDNGVTKGNGAQQGSETEQPEQSQETTPIVASPATNQATTPNKTAEAEQLKENIEIQRKLVAATIGLVIVGILQAVILGWQAVSLNRTIKAIKEQANIMERQTAAAEAASIAVSGQAQSMRYQTTILRESAAAAKDSAEALISAERAWVLAEIDHPERPHTYYEYTLFLRNHGPTPARIEGIFWDVKAIDSVGQLPPISSFGLPELCPQFIAPKGAHEINGVFPNERVSDGKWDEVTRDQTGGKYVICYGYVKYSGIFKGERCSWFCFGYNGLLDWFVPIGPDEYNKAT